MADLNVWRDAGQQILAALDIAAEYRALNVVFASDKPTANGWLPCHAVDRADKTASAAVNVGEGPARGRYKDHGGCGLSCSFWEFAARFGKFADWRAARKHYAAKTDTPLPNGSEPKRPDDGIEFLKTLAADDILKGWTKRKGGFDLKAVRDNGGVYARYPKPAKPEHSQFVAAFPAFNPPQMTDGEPSAWVIANITGEPVRLYKGRDLPPAHMKTMSLGGSVGGLLGTHAQRALAAERDGTGPPVEVVWKVEGLSDMLTLYTALDADGLLGRHVVVSNSQGTLETVKPEWVDLLKGKVVNVIHDSDLPGRTGAGRWVAKLAPHCPQVKDIWLPYEVRPNHGEDLRDFLHRDRRPLAELLDLAEKSPPGPREFSPAPTVPAGEGHSPGGLFDALDEATPPTAIEEADDDPHRLARVFLARRAHADGPTLWSWRGDFHRWDGAYRALDAHEIRGEVTQAVREEFERINRERVAEYRAAPPAGGSGPPKCQVVTCRLVGDVLQALGGMTRLPSHIDQPAWVGGPGPFPAREVLACRNGLVHLPSLVAGSGCFLPPTPGYFSPIALDYDLNLNAPPPARWLAFLNDLWADEPDSVSAIQEWCGYCLTPDTSQQKILVIVGPPRSGKGTIARVLRALVGERNTAGPTLGSLGGNFGLWPLIGKSVAIISDARLSGRTDVAVVTERLLSISGEDALTIDRKNREPLTTKLPTRFVVLTNELPRLEDSSGALAGRLVILRMARSWLGKEARDLTDKLIAELPGILLWAIEGWKRLTKRGHLVQPAGAIEMVETMRSLSSPVAAFVGECCVLGDHQRALKKDLYTHWCLWCREKGRKNPGVEEVFFRDLLAAFPTLRRSRPVDSEAKKRVNVYEGIAVPPLPSDTPGEGSECPDIEAA